MQRTDHTHYATLGLDQDCTADQIRSAYRLLAKQLHPDLNGGAAEAQRRTQQLNAAHETLRDPRRREAYDEQLAREQKRARATPAGRGSNIKHDAHLRIEEFLRGTTLEVRVTDPGDPDGPELYALVVPPETAPGSRFKVARSQGGYVTVHLRARPNARFKIRGSDLRCDLRIHPRRAAQGGSEMLAGPTGQPLRVTIPRQVTTGEIIRIGGEGLPRPRGGRGDILVRVLYRPDVRVTRTVKR